MPHKVKNDLTGLRFGRYTVMEFVPTEDSYSAFKCRCACGTEKIVLGQSLVRGATKSCGCLPAERAAAASRKHGHGRRKHRSPTYGSWAAMMTRCEWPNSKQSTYQRYGAVGIRVCEEWRDFEKFLSDMGERPPGTSIDRIDVMRGYEPGNCRWATRREQALNTKRTVRVIYQGRRTTAAELCEELGLSYKAIASRKKRRGGDWALAFKSVGVEVTRAFGAEHGVEWSDPQFKESRKAA